MTGPEHYREAEQLLAEGESVVQEIRDTRGDEARRDALGKQAMGIWAQAQVHATLALAAASIEPVIRQGIGSDLTILTDWSETTS